MSPSRTPAVIQFLPYEHWRRWLQMIIRSPRGRRMVPSFYDAYAVEAPLVQP